MGAALDRMADDGLRSFLRDLETKGFDQTVTFTGYGSGSYAGAYGANASFPYIQQRPPGAKYDYQLEAGDLWRNTVAAICFSWIKKNFPEPRAHVASFKKGTGWVEEDGHELAAILENPNGFYDADALWAATNVSWHCDGNAYWLKGQNLAGHTKAFYYVPHWTMFPRWDPDGRDFITHYEYVVDGKRKDIRPDQVVHFRNGIDIRNYRYGNTELGCAVREICTDNEAAGYEASILRNLGMPGWIVFPESADDSIDEDGRKELKKIWRQEFTGEGRGGLLVNSVRLKMERATLSPEELTLDKLRRIPQGRIVAAIGLNEMVLGLHTERPTYANYPESRRAAYHDCIVPTQKSMGKQLARQCPELCRPGQLLRWDYSDVEAMQEDATIKTKRAVVAFQGGLATKDEGRAMINLPPAADGQGDQFAAAAQPIHGSVPGIADSRIGQENEQA